MALPSCDDGPAGAGDTLSFAFGFEDGLQPWATDATDVDDPPAAWTIEITDERAREGSRAVKLQLDNLTDAGKIWIEQRVTVEPNTRYRAEIEFDLATNDWGFVNLWRVLAGITLHDPEIADHLEAREETGNGAEEDLGHVWTERAYVETIESDAAGVLWLHVGVWGTYEVLRSYYLDDVRITLTPI